MVEMEKENIQWFGTLVCLWEFLYYPKQEESQWMKVEVCGSILDNDEKGAQTRKGGQSLPGAP